MAAVFPSSPGAAARGVKRYGYLAFLSTPLLPVAGLVASYGAGLPNAGGWFSLLAFFGLVPILDRLIGEDTSNPRDDEVDSLEDERFFRYLVYACLPVQLLTLAGLGWLFATAPWLTITGKIGLLLSMGLVSTVLGINAAHELIHKQTRLEQTLGGLLLSLVCYGSFKVEHVRGHHVNVSTPKDQSSATFGQSIYRFLPHAVRQNVVAGWRLEASRLSRSNRSAWSLHNEVLRWHLLSACLAALALALLGWAGLVFFLGQAAVAIFLLESVNYLEHYGLRRRQLANGRYERTTHQHSWNSNYVLTNLLLFQLQRHSDHHAWPRRRYQVLRHFDDSPQLPFGYATMLLIAWLPPLWRRVMDPRVRRYYADREALPATAT